MELMRATSSAPQRLPRPACLTVAAAALPSVFAGQRRDIVAPIARRPDGPCRTVPASAGATAQAAPEAGRAARAFTPGGGVNFKTPARDMDYLVNEIFAYPKHYAALGADIDADFIKSIVDEMGKFCENVIGPLNASGDREGCVRHEDGTVTTPKGFKEAYDEFIAGGWAGLNVPEEYGGQGLPVSLNLIKSELIATSNWTWGMYPGLSVGAMNTLALHGSEEQKQYYLTKLAEGTWTGCMCLTEPQCGTDLGQVKTKAVENPDGSYNITGTKIYISCGEHDFTENIVHIVLARKEGAPAGTKGISLFVVPRHLPDGNGGLEANRNLTCGGIEDKMGIHGSSTCVMNFDDSKGWLIGEENRGLNYMFTFMNTARLGTGMQGLGHMELALQGAVPFARDRLSMRSLTGTKYPDLPADPIIVHPDVRKNLLTMKSLTEGCRAYLYYVAQLADDAFDPKASEAQRKVADDKLGFFTPVVKAFLTELGMECANHGITIHGGHGFIKDYGMEQILRDARISTLYEGTTGVQALDLLGRKTLMDKGKALRAFNTEILKFCQGTFMSNSDLLKETFAVTKLSVKWLGMTTKIMVGAGSDRDIVGSASVDYLMYSGYLSVAYMWLKMMKHSSDVLAGKVQSDLPREFHETKITTGKFYFDRVLPRAYAHADMATRAPTSIMKLDADRFDSQLEK